MVVALFEREPRARQAVQAVLDLGVDEHAVGLLAPGSSSTVTSDVARLLAVAAADGGDITTVLASLGVPEGEARFCAQETSNGRTIVVVDAGSGFEAVRDALLRHGGYDVQSRGRELARANGAGVDANDHLAGGMRGLRRLRPKLSPNMSAVRRSTALRRPSARTTAPRPPSTSTTPKPRADADSIPDRAANPPSEDPYPMLVGTATTGRETSPAMTEGKAPSIPATCARCTKWASGSAGTGSRPVSRSCAG